MVCIAPALAIWRPQAPLCVVFPFLQVETPPHAFKKVKASSIAAISKPSIKMSDCLTCCWSNRLMYYIKVIFERLPWFSNHWRACHCQDFVEKSSQSIEVQFCFLFPSITNDDPRVGYLVKYQVQYQLVNSKHSSKSPQLPCFLEMGL
ncbi:hypothetical protein GOP47_0004874 [Adiantum capillus-veneris]|uniref:Uncharacterized protein n=1 Tax=Adiantum capillus-veneris TaxID=13818 RepID=A0A9D4V433_ADICA|nr:hypothetical protein GOP47_0004874 [Adiantum capillus-veneris]